MYRHTRIYIETIYMEIQKPPFQMTVKGLDLLRFYICIFFVFKML